MISRALAARLSMSLINFKRTREGVQMTVKRAMIAAVGAVLLAAGCSNSIVTKRTQVVVYQPWTSQGTISSSLHVTATLHSTLCIGDGVAGNSSYRCFTTQLVDHRNIFDPCFARPQAATGPVLCPINPANPHVVEIDVSTLGSPDNGAAKSRIWAIQLAGGQVCIAVNAAWAGLGPFSCSPSNPGQVPNCHTPQPDMPWWFAQCEEKNGGPFTAQRVVKVWS